MQMKSSTCNNCGKDVELVESNYHTVERGDLKQIGLKCPHCKTFYHAYYLTDKLIKQQHAMKEAKTKNEFKRIEKNYKKAYIRVQAKGIGLEVRILPPHLYKG